MTEAPQQREPRSGSKQCALLPWLLSILTGLYFLIWFSFPGNLAIDLCGVLLTAVTCSIFVWCKNRKNLKNGAQGAP